jgi:hypothetical protein
MLIIIAHVPKCNILQKTITVALHRLAGLLEIRQFHSGVKIGCRNYYTTSDRRMNHIVIE